MKRIVLFCVLALVNLPAVAQQTEQAIAVGGEERYISDVLYVPVRSGQTTQHRIVHNGIRSGTKVVVLESNEESGYSRIRTSRGTEGWVPSRYLMPEPTARIKLSAAQSEIDQLKSRNRPLHDQLDKLKTDNQSLSKDVRQLKRSNQQLTDELGRIKKISANAITLDNNNQELLKKNELMKNEIDVLTAENERLTDKSEQEAFINGAGAVGFGVILALLVPRLMARRKKTDWG